MKKHFWTITYSVLLTGFTVYFLLDTFLIPNAVQTGAVEMNLSLFETTPIEKELTGVAAMLAPTETIELNENSGSARSKPGKRNLSDKSTGINPTDVVSLQSSAVIETTEAPIAVVEQSDESAVPQVEYKGSYLDGVIIGSYGDPNISITLTTYTVEDSLAYVANVQLTSASYLKTAFANDAYGRNITAQTSVMASEHDAILAINGDYYGAQERGYVIRNGIIYRDTPASADVLCIYADGSMKIVDPAKVSAQELLEDHVWQAFSFGPALLIDGEIPIGTNTEVGRAMASNPRTAIGIIDDLHYVFVVSDGRTAESEGLSLYELAEFMQSLGVQTAYNLDGGGSSTMVFQGNIINNPTTNGRTIRERSISDIIYIG